MEWDARGMHVHLLNISTQEEPPGSIPNDMAAIRRWLGSPSEDIWRRVRPQIFAAWELRGERWVSPGMERTFEKKANYASRPQNGTKTVPHESHNHVKNVLDVSLDLDFSNSKPQKPSKSKHKFYLPDWIPKETWQAFEEMRRKIRKNMTDHAKELAVKDLASLKADGHDPKAVLDQSIMNSWQALYPLKLKANGNGKAADKHARDKETISRIYEELHPEDVGHPKGNLLKLSPHG